MQVKYAGGPALRVAVHTGLFEVKGESFTSTSADVSLKPDGSHGGYLLERQDPLTRVFSARSSVPIRVLDAVLSAIAKFNHHLYRQNPSKDSGMN